MTKLLQINNTQTVSSIEVAEMIKKNHNKLMRDIRNYIDQLGESNFGHTDFFAESEYITTQNKKAPCYNVTKKGCEFIAHKLTGVKGTEFTARYINRFHELEEQNKPQLPTTYLDALKELVAREEEKQQLIAEHSAMQKEIAVKDQIIGELKPKADYTDIILSSKKTITVNQIACDYGMSSQELNKLLHSLHIQYKQSKTWLLYNEYRNCGYTQTETHHYGNNGVNIYTKWTQKGRLFLYKVLKENGYLPMIERDIA